MEDPAQNSSRPQASARTLADPDFIGAESALKRAAAKAIARARRAGLEPVIWKSPAEPMGSVLREEPPPDRTKPE